MNQVYAQGVIESPVSWKKGCFSAKTKHQFSMYPGVGIILGIWPAIKLNLLEWVKYSLLYAALGKTSHFPSATAPERNCKPFLLSLN